MAVSSPSLEYHQIWLADFFHLFPHIDLSFEEVNSTFNPENNSYREALGFWACVPAVWCVVLSLAFLVFFCLRCCQKSERKQAKTTCACVCSGLFLFIGCGALAAAFYGNETMHGGVGSFVDAVKMTNRTVKSALGVLDTLDVISMKIKAEDLPSLQRAVGTISNFTARTKIAESLKPIGTNLDEAKNDIISVRNNATQVNTENVEYYTQTFEYYRWVCTIMVFCVFIVIFIMVFIGLLRKSKWMLMVAATLSVIFMLFLWLAAALYLALSVASGDLCVDPNSYVVSKVQGTIKKQILLDYIECSEKTHQPYLLGDILDAQTSVSQAITALNTTVNISAPFLDKVAKPAEELRMDLKSAFGNLSSLASLVGNCDTIHAEYIQALNGICHTALIGVAFLVLFSALVGVSATTVVFCTAHAWPYLGKRRHQRRRDYAPVDDTDPFLPNPPPYDHDYGSMRAANVPDTAGSSGSVDFRRQNQDRHPVNDLPMGESPPPAYQAGGYMQQYYNLAPRPSSIQQSSSDA